MRETPSYNSIYFHPSITSIHHIRPSVRPSVHPKRSNLKTHAMSKEHRLNKGKPKKIGKREEDIVQALQKYDQEHHPKGETLSTPTRVFRIKVVQAFLKSGTPLNRLEVFRKFLKKQARVCHPHIIYISLSPSY